MNRWLKTHYRDKNLFFFWSRGVCGHSFEKKCKLIQSRAPLLASLKVCSPLLSTVLCTSKLLSGVFTWFFIWLIRIEIMSMKQDSKIMLIPGVSTISLSIKLFKSIRGRFHLNIFVNQVWLFYLLTVGFP